MRDARLAARFGVRELARRIGVNPALLSSWELGYRVPGPEEVAGMLGALGVTGEEKEWIARLARGIAGPGWFTPGSQASPTHFAALKAHERAALSLSVWAPIVFPDLLQTPGYARFARGTESQDVTALEALMRRRDVLFGAQAVSADFFIGEDAVYNHFGDDVMAQQLRFIVDLAVRARTITVRLLPRLPRRSVVLPWAFTTYRMEDSPPVVYCPHHCMGVFLVGEHATPYEAITAKLADQAMPPSETVGWLSAEADRLARSSGSQSLPTT
ncbi:helix-turn-helix transcriptional regulator [Amycolatopsis halotolerans]|uniref:Helix-turn-helix transcriptional regulator n=1 Tax=Amycolatopsis halotolerans TaxID=330083 RepID=A0ABV7QJS1_9PSEU